MGVGVVDLSLGGVRFVGLGFGVLGLGSTR